MVRRLHCASARAIPFGAAARRTSGLAVKTELFTALGATSSAVPFQPTRARSTHLFNLGNRSERRPGGGLHTRLRVLRSTRAVSSLQRRRRNIDVESGRRRSVSTTHPQLFSKVWGTSGGDVWVAGEASLQRCARTAPHFRRSRRFHMDQAGPHPRTPEDFFRAVFSLSKSASFG